jgi:hypothetical protein
VWSAAHRRIPSMGTVESFFPPSFIDGGNNKNNEMSCARSPRSKTMSTTTTLNEGTPGVAHCGHLRGHNDIISDRVNRGWYRLTQDRQARWEMKKITAAGGVG